LIAANLAVALAQNPPLRVGLLDVDVFGPSLPRLMGLSGKPPADAGDWLTAAGRPEPVRVDHLATAANSDIAVSNLMQVGTSARRGVGWTFVELSHDLNRLQCDPLCRDF